MLIEYYMNQINKKETIREFVLSTRMLGQIPYSYIRGLKATLSMLANEVLVGFKDCIIYEEEFYLSVLVGKNIVITSKPITKENTNTYTDYIDFLDDISNYVLKNY